MALSTQAVDIRQLAAAIFDLDGVITDAATVHAAAWKRLSTRSCPGVHQLRRPVAAC